MLSQALNWLCEEPRRQFTLSSILRRGWPGFANVVLLPKIAPRDRPLAAGRISFPNTRHSQRDTQWRHGKMTAGFEFKPSRDPTVKDRNIPADNVAHQAGRGELEAARQDCKLPGMIQELRMLRSRTCSEVSP